MDEAKRSLVQSWLSKASNDLRAAEKLSEGERPVLDVAVYHCQQAAEKAIKGFLTCHDRRFEKTHDIQVLVNQATSIEPLFGAWLPVAQTLTPYATVFRYPGAVLVPPREEFDEAFAVAAEFCAFVISLLPPAVHPSG